MICNKSTSIDDSITEEWITRLPTLLYACDEKDVFNADETESFYHATFNRSLILSKEDSKARKK